MLPYYVYILECADSTFYIGSTNDLEKRLHAHNTSKTGAHYTKIRRPVVLRYSERLKTKSLALKREHTLKKLSRKEKDALCTHAKQARGISHQAGSAPGSK
jgi:putative endonuclease